MTAEVDWVLDQLADVVDSVAADYSRADDWDNDPVEVRRVDRDDAQTYDGSDSVDLTTPLPQRQGALSRGVYLSAGLADRATEPIGTEYDHDLETVVALRVEGMHHTQSGHIDPAGDKGVPFPELVSRVRTALLAERKSPDAGPADVAYTHLELANEVNRSEEFRDFYDFRADVRFSGFETLP